jgi:hypothetical protein
VKDFLHKYIYPLARLERFIYPIALFIGAFGLFHWYWTTTPSYAITGIVEAVRKHDPALVEKYVDIDSIASHAFDDLLDGPARSELLGRMDTFVGVGFVRFFKQEIVGIAHERICSAIADRRFNFEAVSDGSTDTLRQYKITPAMLQAMFDFGLTRYGFKGIKYLDVKGNYALLGLDFFSPKLNQSYTVEFRMEDVGGYWRVTQITNLNDLVTLYLQGRQALDKEREQREGRESRGVVD